MAATVQLKFASEASLSCFLPQYRADLFATTWTLYEH